jgi:Cu(I)/Ag(I) efflux system membrane fusion protein
MNRINPILAVLVLGAALALAWWAGRASAPMPDATTAPAARPAAAEPAILYYRNPMGLPDTSPVPKQDSMGMDYLPVYAGDQPAAEPGTVVLPPEKIQLLGVRTETAAREALSSTVRVSASVQVDETRMFAIAPRFEGWIETLYANQTGMTVERGQPLMAIYSPELIAAQREYQVADSAARRLADSDPASAATMRDLRDAARTRLRNWEVAGAGAARRGRDARLVISAPADAVVVDKLVVQGDRFQPGQTVLRLADLSTVWVVAQVPATAAADLTVGATATFTTASLPGQRFAGAVSFMQPVIDAATRTVGVRIALPNADGALRPGLFGEVELAGAARDAAVVIPRSAVIDSGTRQRVLVQGAPGRFTPRDVRLGLRAGDRVEVLSGVAAGESVVVSANFLIDAESNLRAALDSMAPAEPPPAADHGSHGGGAAAEDHSGHGGRTPAEDHSGHGDGTPREAHGGHGDSSPGKARGDPVPGSQPATPDAPEADDPPPGHAGGH